MTKMICIKRGAWMETATKRKTIGPQFGDVVTVTGRKTIDGKSFVALAEWPAREPGRNPPIFRAHFFRPPVNPDQQFEIGDEDGFDFRTIVRIKEDA